MEGVLVSAQKSGSPITISVVSDANGSYRFPGAKLGPGRYAIRVRAAGYELKGAPEADVKPGTPGRLDLRLTKTADLAAQLTNAEWMSSMPGTPQEKRALLNCIACHTLERVVRSKYTAEEFLTAVLPRMQSYVNQSMPGAPQLRKGERPRAQEIVPGERALDGAAEARQQHHPLERRQLVGELRDHLAARDLDADAAQGMHDTLSKRDIFDDVEHVDGQGVLHSPSSVQVG